VSDVLPVGDSAPDGAGAAGAPAADAEERGDQAPAASLVGGGDEDGAGGGDEADGGVGFDADQELRGLELYREPDDPDGPPRREEAAPPPDQAVAGPPAEGPGPAEEWAALPEVTAALPPVTAAGADDTPPPAVEV